MNTKKIIIAGTLIISGFTYAQKEELKALKKIYAKDEIKGADLAEYKALVSKVEPLATEEGDKVYATFYKAMLPVLELNALDKNTPAIQAQMIVAKNLSPTSISNFEKGLNATLDYEKKTGKKIQTDDILETITSYKPELVNIAVKLGNDKKYKESSEILYSIYKLDKKDADKLYYAANYALNAEDPDKALQYYQELKSINYTGEGTTYLAINKATGKDETFTNKADRDKLVLLGTHSNPKEEKNPSVKGEIYKNIAALLVQKGQNEEAKAALIEAKKENPKDTAIILAQADLLYKLKDMEGYKKSIGEALAINPNDADLIFNLGIVSAASNQFADAEKYYAKVIELKPDYVNAYINLADLKLKPDAKIVEEMNKLGNSEKDLKRYNVIKLERQNLFNSALPLLEKAHELDKTNETIKQNLKSVYSFLELTDKVKALKNE
ncbi:MAG: hypothetical protein H7239_14390 [Flavobacterium sp.]|nr:hypothetical protein [Flavobacterium sp.]